MFGEALGSVGLGGSSALGAGTMGMMGLSAATTAYNMYQQERQYKYEKNLQGKIFNREDNAIQRRVADLRAAGLSPVLAAGNGAQAGQVVSTTAPQVGDLADKYRQLISMSNEIAMSRTQRDLLESQKQQSDATKNNIFLDSERKRGDNKVYKKWNELGIPSTAIPDLQKIGFAKGVFDDVTKSSTDKPVYPISKQAPGESNRAYYQRKLMEQKEQAEKDALNKKYGGK